MACKSFYARSKLQHDRKTKSIYWGIGCLLLPLITDTCPFPFLENMGA